jgi:hypothetical protein
MALCLTYQSFYVHVHMYVDTHVVGLFFHLNIAHARCGLIITLMTLEKQFLKHFVKDG